MKAVEIISIVDELKENNVSDEMKLFWLNEVEGLIGAEVYKKDPGDFNIVRSMSDELIAIDPYSRIYVLYLEAMIAFNKGEYDTYLKINAEFEKTVSAYSKFVIRNR